jgi:hypothetical protein
MVPFHAISMFLTAVKAGSVSAAVLNAAKPRLHREIVLEVSSSKLGSGSGLHVV